MRKVILFIPFFLLCINLKPSFPFNRQEIINQSLTQIETAGDYNTFAKNEYVPETDKNLQQYLASTKADKPKAREQAIDKTLYICAALDYNRMHYSEWDNDQKLDEDYGHHSGYYVALGYRSPNYYEWLGGKPFIEGYFKRFSNLIRYKGAIIGGGPFDCKQRSVVQQFGVKIGSRREFFSKGEVFGYADIGERVWHRGEDEILDGVRLYGEKYYWTYIGLGAGINYEIAPKFFAGIDATWLLTFDGTRKLHANDIGFGDVTYKLGDVWGLELKAPFKYTLLKNLSLDLTPYFTYWSIGKSEYVPMGGQYWYEPDSKTHIEGVLAGFTLGF